VRHRRGPLVQADRRRAAHEARSTSIRASTTDLRSRAVPPTTTRRSATGLACWTCSIDRWRFTETTEGVKPSTPPERDSCIDEGADARRGLGSQRRARS
jgi:hypothetical protein